MPIKKQWLSLEEFEKIQGGDWSPGPHTHVKVDITDTPWAWADVLKTGSNLTDLTTRLHSSLQSIGANDHHAQAHTLLSHTARDHHHLTGLGDDDHSQYLLASGARALTGNWDAGAFQIRALKFYSDQATGTAPLTVLSTTMVTNLNADRWHNCAVSGLTIGHVLKATGAAAIAFQANNLGGLSDVTLGSLEEGETIRYDQATTKWIDAWGVEYDNPRLVWKMYTDFFSSAVDSNDPWVGAAFGGGCVPLAGTSNHPGITRLSSSVANSGYRFMTAINCIRIAGAEHSEFCFKTGSIQLNARLRLGYQDSTTSTAPTDGVYIDISGTTLTGKTRNNGSESTTGTSYTLSASTWYRAKIAVNSNATLITFILYSEAGTQLWSNTLSANIPTASGRETGHGVVMFVATSVARTFDIDMMIATRAGYITR